MTSYAQIDRQAMLFATFTQPVLNGRIPRGELTIIAGEGGCGKGQMGVWMAVDQALQGHHVVLVTPEDNLEVTVRPRLEATVRALVQDADDDRIADVLSRVHDLTFTPSGAPFELSADGKHEGSVGQLRLLVDNPTLDGDEPDLDYDGPACRLVVIDPLLACLAYGSIATNVGARRVLAPLQRLAAETWCALVLTHHTVESGKVAGSKGLTDAARLVYRAKKDRENPGIRVLEIDKTNILPESDPVRYQILGKDADTYVRWLDRDELMARRRQPPERRPQSPRSLVLAASLDGKLDVAGLAEVTGLDVSAVAEAVAQLEAEGLVGRKRKFSWR